MRVTIRAPHVDLSDAARDYVGRRVRQAFEHVEDRIVSAQIRIDDANGPKGGVDKACLVIANCGRLGLVQTEGRDRDLRTAVDLALERAKTAIEHDVKKRVTLRKSKVPHRRAPR